MDGSSSAPIATSDGAARFGYSGGRGEDVEEFLQEAARNRARARTLYDDQGKDIWLQPYLEARLAEPARSWYKNLDENVRGDWDSAREALRMRYGSRPPPATAPEAPGAATRPWTRESTAVEAADGDLEYHPPPVPVARPHSSWFWMLMVKIGLLSVSELTKR